MPPNRSGKTTTDPSDLKRIHCEISKTAQYDFYSSVDCRSLNTFKKEYQEDIAIFTLTFVQNVPESDALGGNHT
jgi:hypothetical protein